MQSQAGCGCAGTLHPIAGNPPQFGKRCCSDDVTLLVDCWSTAHRDEGLGCLECPGQPEISFHTTAANSAMIFC